MRAHLATLNPQELALPYHPVYHRLCPGLKLEGVGEGLPPGDSGWPSRSALTSRSASEGGARRLLGGGEDDDAAGSRGGGIGS